MGRGTAQRSRVVEGKYGASVYVEPIAAVAALPLHHAATRRGPPPHACGIGRRIYSPQRLPPKSPELNPVENIWWFMRENWMSNRVFTSYKDILDHCCEAWSKLTDRPWLIMSIGLRDWAHQC